jgi:hypothetical protein
MSYESAQEFAQKNLIIDDPSRRGNPLQYAVVKHNRFLFDCLTPASAYCQQNYPYGNRGERCLQRYWCEQGQKGAKKGQWRLMSQTTTPAWNERYTENLKHVASLEPGEKRDSALSVLSSWLLTQWDTIRMTDGKPYWNNPKGGVYHYFSVWEEMHCWKPEQRHDNQTVDTSKTPTPAVRPFVLHYHSEPEDFRLLTEFPPIKITAGQMEGINNAAILSKFPLESIRDRIEVIH